MATALDKEMYSYFIRLNDTEKKSVIKMLKASVKERKQATWQISIEQYNKEIDEAMADLENGDIFTHEEVVKISKDW